MPLAHLCQILNVSRSGFHHWLAVTVWPDDRAMPLNVGSRLGHYDVTALIGEGGLGQVYQATDTRLNSCSPEQLCSRN